MKKSDIAVVICNYNGGMDTIKCIDTVMKSQNVSLDIYVVDNASTDGSPDRIREHFGTQVTIIQNPENLGGSGGFGRGLRMALKEGYSYIMMVDNDAYVEQDTIKKLYEYLLKNPDVGMVGAKIMMADDPERIMDYAKTIDFETFIDGSKWYGQLDSADASIPRECDFAAATAAMLPGTVLEKCGGMDEAYFIYYDDIELGYRIKQYGYKVISLGSAKAWHKSGMSRKTTNTFVRYYLARNRHHFFAKYISGEDIERFAEHILFRAFSYMYGSYYKGRMDIFNTEKYILEDFIYDRRGKAGNQRVNEIYKEENALIKRELEDCRHVLVLPEQEGLERHLVKWCRKIAEMNPKIRIVINAAFYHKKEEIFSLEQLKENALKDIQYVENAQDINKENYDKVIHFCRHVKEVKNNLLPEICLDIYGNMIAAEQDYIYFRNYEKSYAFFKAIYHDSVTEAISRIRKENRMFLT